MNTDDFKLISTLTNDIDEDKEHFYSVNYDQIVVPTTNPTTNSAICLITKIPNKSKQETKKKRNKKYYDKYIDIENKIKAYNDFNSSDSELSDLSDSESDPLSDSLNNNLVKNVQIFVINENNNLTYPIFCNLNMTVLDLKELIQDETKINVCLQNLMYKNIVLDDTKLLIGYNFEPNCKVSCFCFKLNRINSE
jgi:hypothetical protein